MNRRSFIKTTGISLGTVLLSDDLFAGSLGPGSLIALPDEVLAVVNNQSVVLLRHGNDAWENQDVRV